MKEIKYPQLGESVFRGKLENGLTVSVIPRRGFTKCLAYFVTNYGSMETHCRMDGRDFLIPAGTAHYLEHKMFDLPDRDVSAEFAALGASPNAFTSYDMTAYYFSCTSHFDACLKLLLEFVSTPYFTEESVRKEQGIIGQEIRMCEDEPETRIFELLMEMMYRNHPIRVPILGTAKSIAGITAQTLYECHRSFYVPDNMMLCVIGDVDPEQVMQIAASVLSGQKQATAEKAPDVPEDMTVVQPLRRTKMDVSMPLFSLGFKCEPAAPGNDSMRQEIVGDLAAEALFGESSALYLQLYESGLIDSSFGGGYESIRDMAMLNCSGDSENPEAVRDAILAQAKQLQQNGIPEKDFLRMKRSALGRKIRDLDSFDSTCFRLCAGYFTKIDYFDFPSVYSTVEVSEILEFLSRVAVQERCALSIIDPLPGTEKIKEAVL